MRIDRGVFVFFNVVFFVLLERLDFVCLEVFNYYLSDVWVFGIVEVFDDFYLCFWVKFKIYCYYLVNEGFDFSVMRECVSFFVGRYDFLVFVKFELGRDLIREVERVEVIER